MFQIRHTPDLTLSRRLATSPYNTVSFIATITGTVTVVVYGSNPVTTYTLQAFDGNLSLGTSRAASTYNESIYYSFEATANAAYQVQVTPRSGNADIGSVYAKLTASVGNSMLAGIATDTVTFLAPATQRYYVRVGSNSEDTTFDVKVSTTSSNPDLTVVIDSATSDTSNIAINYTVYNKGINAAGAFGVTGWSNATTAPTVGPHGRTALNGREAGSQLSSVWRQVWLHRSARQHGRKVALGRCAGVPTFRD